MRHVGAGLVLVAAAFLALAGCNHAPVMGTGRSPAPPPAYKAPEPAALVKYLNDNAARVQSVSCEVDIQAQMGKDGPVGVGGLMACRTPRDFRLKGKVMGSPQVDFGSNGDEFWYWIGKATPPHVYHCSYKELATGKVHLPFPFQPDMVVSALGMAQYDPDKKYELKDDPRSRYLEMVESATSPSGQPVQKVTVFQKTQVKAPHPQVVAHVLKDAKGTLIAQATIHEVTVDGKTGAVVPTKVTLEWPAQKMKMTMKLYSPKVNGVDAAMAARLFNRGELKEMSSFNLAKGAVDGPGGVRHAGTLPPRESYTPRR